MRKPTQDDGMLYALQAEWSNWTPASRLAKISLQYSSRIFSLRRKGWQIATKIEIRNGIKYDYFRLGSPPVPRSSEPRASGPKVADALIDRPAALFDMHRSPD